MNDDTRNLIDRMTDRLMQITHDEREIGRVLQLADEDTRSEVAFYMADAVNSHPNRPSGIHTSLSKVEKFIGHRVNIADWHARSDQLDADWEDLQNAFMDIALLDEDDRDTLACQGRHDTSPGDVRGNYDEDDLTA